MSSRFRHIGIIGKPGDNRVGDTVNKLIGYLNAQGMQVCVDLQTAENFPMDGYPGVSLEKMGTDSDLIMVVGGDGTLLGAARSMAATGVPLLGINLGRLGFLVDISPDDMLQTLDQVLAGEYEQEKRFLLEARIGADSSAAPTLAINDVVLHKWNTPRMVEFDTYVDGKLVNTQRSDGLIISTPTGSTAYALSVGGPLMLPSLDALLLAPICPHTLSNRPIVVDADSRIEVRLCLKDAGFARISCDGQADLEMKPGERLFVRKYPHAFTLLHPKGHDHYKILRAKLGWGGNPSL